MKAEHRREPRFEESGRVEATDLCELPGVLDDISATGCKVRFPVPIKIDMESDYNIKVKIPHKKFDTTFSIVCKPKWISRCGSQSNVGFIFLCSPGIPFIKRYINYLKADSAKEISSL